MVLYFLRGAFVLLAAAVAALYVLPTRFENEEDISFMQSAVLMLGAVVVAGAVILADIFSKEKKLAHLTGIFLGLIGGLVAAYALSFMVDLFVLLYQPGDPEGAAAMTQLAKGTKVLIGLITCYLGMSVVMQTKDDFRFVVPYVEFAKEVRGMRPTVLDTSVIIDGRIVDILNTHIMQGPMIVPQFVLHELQLVADSADKIRRARGRRGLEILQKLQENAVVEVSSRNEEFEGTTVDQKLVAFAKEMRGRLMTNDYNLNKVASLRGVDVINLNELAKAMRPVVLPGEQMEVKLVKPGESHGQAVGYLEDGTMVVVEGGRPHIQEMVELTVTSTLQTSAGRMIFGRYYGDTTGPHEGHEQGAQRREAERSRDADTDSTAHAASEAPAAPSTSGALDAHDDDDDAYEPHSNRNSRNNPRKPRRHN